MHLVQVTFSPLSDLTCPSELQISATTTNFLKNVMGHDSDLFLHLPHRNVSPIITRLHIKGSTSEGGSVITLIPTQSIMQVNKNTQIYTSRPYISPSDPRSPSLRPSSVSGRWSPRPGCWSWRSLPPDSESPSLSSQWPQLRRSLVSQQPPQLSCQQPPWFSWIQRPPQLCWISWSRRSHQSRLPALLSRVTGSRRHHLLRVSGSCGQCHSLRPRDHPRVLRP